MGKDWRKENVGVAPVELVHYQVLQVFTPSSHSEIPSWRVASQIDHSNPRFMRDFSPLDRFQFRFPAA